MSSDETSALPPAMRATLAKALSEHRRAALASIKGHAARSRISGGGLDAEAVVDALEHSFELCVTRQLQEFTRAGAAVDPKQTAAQRGAAEQKAAAASSPPVPAVRHGLGGALVDGPFLVDGLCWRYQMACCLRGEPLVQ